MCSDGYMSGCPLDFVWPTRPCAGLHVSPSEDDVLSSVLPGAQKVYTYNIMSDHVMGTHWYDELKRPFWAASCFPASLLVPASHLEHDDDVVCRYHAHKHGAVALQVGGGLHGLLILEPTDAAWAAMPADVKALYSSSNPYNYEMVLSHLFFGDGDPSQGDMSQFSYPELWSLFGNQTVQPDGLVSTAEPSFYVVNNQFQPSVEVSAGSVALLRMVNTGGSRVLVLKFAQSGICSMRLMARDGVFQQDGYPTVTRMVLHPGTRLDVAVLCQPGPTASYPVDVTVYADIVDIAPMVGNAHAQPNVFTLRVVSAAKSQQAQQIPFFPTGNVALPSYFGDLRTATPEWSKIIDLDDFAVNGQFFSAVPPLQ